jgi:uncharacterized phage-associated protein
MRTSKREKLFHAIVFFNEHTKACHKVKLCKLLYFLDFEIYRQTGKSTTGLPYFAWPMGPVPREFFDELSAPRADMKKALVIHTAPADDPDGDRRLTILPRIDFDESLFTKRELKEMERLAEIYRTATGAQMKLASHERGLPWHQIYEVQGRHQELIPYDLILDDRPDSVTKERADEIEREGRAVAILFK